MELKYGIKRIYAFITASPRSNPVGETVGARVVEQSTMAWFCRGKLGGTDLQG